MSGTAIRQPNQGWDASEGVSKVAMLRWDTDTLAWVKVSGGTTEGPDVNVTNFPADPATATGQTNIQTKIGDVLADYKISDIDADASPNYYGFLRKDGAWYILKETVSAGADTYRYVKGASGYNWSNRASESYVTFDSAF